MSRVLDDRGLAALFRLSPNSVALDQAPRLLDVVRRDRPHLVGAVMQHFLTRLPAGPRSAKAMVTFIGRLGDNEKHAPLVMAMRAHCDEVIGRRGRVLH